MTIRKHPQVTLNTGFNRPGEHEEPPAPDWQAVPSDYLAKKQGELPPHPLDGLPARPPRHRGLNSWEPAQLTESPEWHAVMTPQPVYAAAPAVTAAVESVEEPSPSWER